MTKATLNEVTVKHLAPPEKGFKIYLDKTGPKGFGVRVTDKGAKAYVLTYGKERKRVTLGDVGVVTIKTARDRAKNILAEHQLSGDRTPSPATKDALDRFLAHYQQKNKPSTVKETERLLNRFLPVEGKLSDLTRSSMVSLIDGIDSVSERRHFFTAAHTFFRWARRYDHPNPLEGVEKPAKSLSRDRLITADEVKAIWAATLQMGTYGLLCRLLIVTGQRLNQIVMLQADYVDRSKKTIIWPPKLMKTNKEFLFPYGDLLHSLLPQGDGLFFTTEEGKPFNNWSNSHTKLLDLCKVPHFTRHDFRRFYSSTHSELGTPPHIRELLLSHSVGSVVQQTYDRYSYLSEKRTAQAAYESHLTTLLNLG